MSVIELEVGLPDAPTLRSVTIEPKSPWTKPAPEFVLDLSGRSLDTSRLFKANRTAHSKTLDTFAGASHVIGACQVVQGKAIFNRYTDVAGSAIRRMALHHGKYANLETGLRMEGDRCVLPAAKLEGAERLEGRVLLGTPDEPDNWGMWLLIGLPSMAEFRREPGRYDRFLCYARAEWQTRLMAWMGLAAGEVVEQNRAGAYLCHDATMLRYSSRDLIVPPSDRAVFEEIADRAVSASAGPACERLFVSRIGRTKRGAYRGLVNEEALIDALSELGFRAVEPETLSFAEQAAAFASAKAIVGLGGAGMFNAVFCRPGTRIVTMESGTGFIDAHTNLFGSGGCPYGVILGREDETDPRRTQKRWSVDVAAAVEQIRRFL